MGGRDRRRARLGSLVGLVLLVVGITAPIGLAAPAVPSAPVAPAAPPVGSGAVQLIFDTSGSMADEDAKGAVKIEGARSAILNFVAGVEPATRLGLWTYPGKRDCDAGQQVIPIAEANGAAMSATVRTLTPSGGTPTGEALLAAAARLDADGVVGGTIILVSDGHHTCSQDPCEAARTLAAADQEVQVITVGFKVDEAGAAELRCIAEAAKGRFVPVEDNVGLIDELTSLTRPELRVDLVSLPRLTWSSGRSPTDFQTEVEADVGAGADGLVEITATIANDSDVPARNVVAMLEIVNTPDDPAGVRPGIAPSLVQRVGNITRDQSAAVSVTWAFRAGLILAGKDVTFLVRVRSVNSTADATLSGRIHIKDADLRLEAGGPVLTQAEHLVIMGDSYSAGEGSGGYVDDTDSPGNRCHRSEQTYLLPLYRNGSDHNLACSGAVTAHITGPDKANGEPSQIAKLRALQATVAVDAVALTIGGNDIHFKDILLSCLFLPSCEATMGLSAEPTSQYVDRYFKALVPNLRETYLAINTQLNNRHQVGRRGGSAPILVSAYPRVLPGADRGACLSLVTIGQGELDFASALMTRLNGTIQGVVEGLQAQGVPIFFVDAVEDAFLPDHTVCDATDKQYARSIESVGLLDPSLGEQLQLVSAFLRGGPLGTAHAAYIAAQAQGRRLQELFHPNLLGYGAWTWAILRWSNSDAGRAAATFEAKPIASDGLQVEDAPPQGVIEVDDGSGGSIDRGQVYTVVGGGFLQGSAVSVELHSDPRVLGTAEADADGRVTFEVAVPRSAPAGDHAVVLAGIDPAGGPLAVERRVSVSTGSGLPVGLILLALAVLSAVAGAGLWRAATGRTPARIAADVRLADVRPVGDGPVPSWLDGPDGPAPDDDQEAGRWF